MSNDIATVTITGRLGADPEVKDKHVKYRVASNYWNGKEEATSWFFVKDFRKNFEKRAEWLSKGSQITVTGDLAIEEWIDKQTGAKRNAAVIAASGIVLPPKSSNGNERTQAGNSGGATGPSNMADDDIPFAPFGYRSIA